VTFVYKKENRKDVLFLMVNFLMEDFMKKLFVLILLISISISFSCRRISPVSEGELKRINVQDLKGIPTEFGSLISVTTTAAAAPGWAQLWFEDDEKTIRMVRIKYTENRIAEDVIIIPRY
jgi:hypothetical protein